MQQSPNGRAALAEKLIACANQTIGQRILARDDAAVEARAAARRRQDEIQLPSVGQPVFNALEEQELVLVSPPTARLSETPRAVRGLVDELHRLFSLQVRAASDKSEVRLLGLFLRRM